MGVQSDTMELLFQKIEGAKSNVTTDCYEAKLKLADKLLNFKEDLNIQPLFDTELLCSQLEFASKSLILGIPISKSVKEAVAYEAYKQEMLKKKYASIWLDKVPAEVNLQRICIKELNGKSVNEMTPFEIEWIYALIPESNAEVSDRSKVIAVEAFYYDDEYNNRDKASDLRDYNGGIVKIRTERYNHAADINQVEYFYVKKVLEDGTLECVDITNCIDGLWSAHVDFEKVKETLGSNPEIIHTNLYEKYSMLLRGEIDSLKKFLESK